MDGEPPPKQELPGEKRQKAYEAAMRRAREQDERGMAQRRQRREQIEGQYADFKLEMQLAALSDPKDVYDRIGPKEKWREHIDGRHQGFGEEVYTKGLHGKPPDKEYNKRLMRTDRYVQSTLGRPFTVDDYIKTHQLAAGGGSKDVDSMAMMLRTDELSLKFAKFEDPVDELQQDDPSGYVKEFRTKGNPKEVVLAKPKRNPLEDVKQVLNNHYVAMDGITDESEKLAIIAHTHKDLENIHPYIDFNTRTNRVVLNRLLAEAGLPLTILENPLNVHHQTTYSFRREIQEGQKRWMDIARQVENPKKEWHMYNKEQELMAKYGMEF